MKKSLTTLFKIFVLTSIFLNCKQQQVISETEFEKAVFYELFPSILDSIYYDVRNTPPPPPPPEFFDKYSDLDKAIKDYKKTDNYKRNLEKRQKTKDSLNNDNSFIYLAVYDSITHSDAEYRDELIKHFKNQNIVLDFKNNELTNSFKIDLDKLESNNKKIKYKYESQFPKGREFWRTGYDFYLAGSIGFDGILFEKTKCYGVLNGGFGMGVLNAYGFRIFIKKDKNGKWVIDEIVETWIS